MASDRNRQTVRFEELVHSTRSICAGAGGIATPKSRSCRGRQTHNACFVGLPAGAVRCIFAGAKGHPMSQFEMPTLVATFGAVIQEVAYWYELRAKLTAQKYDSLMESKAYWS